ncbi:biogenesis of lysosome-related organelles complex 1 subunit 5 [Aplysia californica]|uniref:Biogenesis of lysosome-related organelles complex 1 subunit 5 n=1 Tax=Aplysia californica TaxID=6500 RepID=A0ABM0JR78_APLCA|nr:biogenesis of lysosome-related organelles complex 1 subunit 5 [Aplysia californica]
MTCEYVFRDVTDIYSRLFNHRAAIHGLANNFVKEFEERRGESDHVAISRTLELVTDCRDRAYPVTMKDLDKNLEELSNALKTSSQMCKRIMQDADEKKVDWLESQRARRKHEWGEFMSVQRARKDRVDTDYEHFVKNLHSHYSELEEKLKGGRAKVL